MQTQHQLATALLLAEKVRSPLRAPPGSHYLACRNSEKATFHLPCLRHRPATGDRRLGIHTIDSLSQAARSAARSISPPWLGLSADPHPPPSPATPPDSRTKDPLSKKSVGSWLAPGICLLPKQIGRYPAARIPCRTPIKVLSDAAGTGAASAVGQMMRQATQLQALRSLIWT